MVTSLLRRLGLFQQVMAAIALHLGLLKDVHRRHQQVASLVVVVQAGLKIIVPPFPSSGHKQTGLQAFLLLSLDPDVLDADDKEFLTLLVKDVSRTAAAAAVDHHTEVTHGPLNTQVAEAKEAAGDATESAAGSRKFVLVLAAMCIAIGAAIRGAFTGGQ